ncbi:2-hydroxyacyl-CoA dehydratase [Zhaonella formicivorans]|uniref:2-hydroxyacyl-CoA dehydratase n=1 Tax=Zhaonella formicivorans TaxID=2528593 RepID=UPI0010D0A5E0|nr:2-hydroxyacyl-CoA dehydratase [Zhaonella formicivorans]
MKVSFPRMGTSYIAFKHLIEHLGHECVVPPAPSSKTLNLGVKYSPEFACIPFKVLTGTYIEALEMGADTLITSGGVGPCRAGLYGMLHQKILKNLGYDFEMLVFEPPLLYLVDFVTKLRKILKPAKISWRRFYKELKAAWQKLMVLDDVEILSHQIRPYELHKGSTTIAFNKCLALIDRADSPDEIARSKEECIEILNSVPQDKSRKPLRVGIIGEIYVVLEPFMNLEIEKTLGELGVSTHRSIYLTQWARNNTIINTEGGIRKAAYPYLKRMIGGHGINSLGETVLYAKNGFDGVVQIAPFTCIPEIVAKSILPRVSKDLNIPVLSLTIDEQTGKAGLQTRLEAFVDLLQQKRMMEENVYARFSGN